MKKDPGWSMLTSEQGDNWFGLDLKCILCSCVADWFPLLCVMRERERRRGGEKKKVKRYILSVVWCVGEVEED